MTDRPILDVTFRPAEFALLPRRDLRDTVCVVFDILRATSTMVTALANGANRIIPAATIEEALALRERDPSVLLAGEREGVRIRAAQTGGVDFDLGNSPREFTPAQVQGRTLVMTTTNGTRALAACRGAKAVLLGSFLNLRATVAGLKSFPAANVLLVCAGTQEAASLEDILAAGALVERLGEDFSPGTLLDAAGVARELFRRWQDDLPGAMPLARNGRRLLNIPELKGDVAWCLRVDAYEFAPHMTEGGWVTR